MSAQHAMTKEKPPQGDEPRSGWFQRNQVRLLKYSVVAAFLAVVAGGFYVSYSIFQLGHKGEERDATIAALARNLDSSREQLKDNGITPSAPPAKQVVEQVKGETGAKGDTGAAGVNGAEGPSGPPGPTGPPGPRGSQGQKGDQGNTGTEGVPGAAGQTGPSGAPGTNGANGNDGSNGANGQDGAAGQAGADGSQGPQGEQGPVGPQGPQGDKGDKGEPGDPGTLPDTVTFNHADGSTETCTRTSDTSYNCTSNATPPVSDPPTEPPAGEQVSSYRRDGQEDHDTPVTLSQVYAIVSERKRFI